MDTPIIGHETTYYGEWSPRLWGQRVRITAVLKDPARTGDYTMECHTDEEIERAGGVTADDLAIIVPVRPGDLPRDTVRLPALACFTQLARRLYPRDTFFRGVAWLKEIWMRRHREGTVVIVEPPGRGLDWVVRYLEPEFHAITVDSVDEALAVARDQNVLAVITEYSVPHDQQALDVLKRFRAAHPGLHRILISRVLLDEVHLGLGLVQGLVY